MGIVEVDKNENKTFNHKTWFSLILALISLDVAWVVKSWNFDFESTRLVISVKILLPKSTKKKINPWIH